MSGTAAPAPACPCRSARRTGTEGPDPGEFPVCAPAVRPPAPRAPLRAPALSAEDAPRRSCRRLPSSGCAWRRRAARRASGRSPGRGRSRRWLLVNWFWTCSNGRPILRIADFGMPMPVSSIVTTTAFATLRARTAIRPPSGVNFTALERRFRSTCFMARRSAFIVSPGAMFRLDADALALGRDRGQPHGLLDERREVDALALDLQLPGLDLRHVEDVVDHAEQVLAAAVDVARSIPRISTIRAARTCPSAGSRRSR